MGILQGKTAVITGANRGIGRAVVEQFAKEEAKIWACARKYNSEFESDMTELAEKYNTEIIPLYFDMAIEAEIKEAFKQIYKTRETVDILVNMAGVVNATLFQMTPMHEIRDVFETNFFGLGLFDTVYSENNEQAEKRGYNKCCIYFRDRCKSDQLYLWKQ